MIVRSDSQTLPAQVRYYRYEKVVTKQRVNNTFYGVTSFWEIEVDNVVSYAGHKVYNRFRHRWGTANSNTGRWSYWKRCTEQELNTLRTKKVFEGYNQVSNNNPGLTRPAPVSRGRGGRTITPTYPVAFSIGISTATPVIDPASIKAIAIKDRKPTLEEPIIKPEPFSEFYLLDDFDNDNIE
jgi:hypothetical protein